MIEELVYILRIEAVAPVCLAWLAYVDIVVLVSVVISHQVAHKAYDKCALARFQALSLRTVSHKLPMRVCSIATKRNRLFCLRVEPSCVHIMELHDTLEGQLLWVVIVGRIVKELGFDAIILCACLVIVFEHPAHLNNLIIVVGPIGGKVDPVVHAQLQLAMQAQLSIVLWVKLLILVPEKQAHVGEGFFVAD